MTEIVSAIPEKSSVVSSSDADIYLQIYEKVNARREETQKSYKDNIIVTFSDVKELHNKTIQTINSLTTNHKAGVGVKIVVTHNGGEADKFKSFESFEKHNITSPNPTNSIHLIYNFTLFDNDSNQFENYKITNRISSRIAELQQIEKEAPPFLPKEILFSILTTTAVISIEYTDYVKARHFIAMFEEWIKGCDENKSNSIMQYLKSVSHIIRRFGIFTIYGLLAYFTIKAIDSQIIISDLWIKFVIGYASFFMIIVGIAEMFLMKFERSIDGYLTLSYLNINKGDSKLIKEYNEKNTKTFIWIAVSTLGTILTGVITRGTYDLIHWFILK